MHSGEAFKLFLRHTLASPVGIVSSSLNGIKRAITVGSITSVSLSPPMVLVCLQSKGRMDTLLQQSNHFSIHVLSDQQKAIGEAFADPNLPVEKYEFFGLRFAEDGTTATADLENCLGEIHCQVHSHTVCGDHTVFVGNVKQVSSLQGKGKMPMAYFDRHFCKLDKLSS
jgi:flavin reductase (DIM6/NTAB) family NADH-FMN oxidoreductase RutF